MGAGTAPQADPRRRPTAAQLLQHPFVAAAQLPAELPLLVADAAALSARAAQSTDQVRLAWGGAISVRGITGDRRQRSCRRVEPSWMPVALRTLKEAVKVSCFS